MKSRLLVVLLACLAAACGPKAPPAAGAAADTPARRIITLSPHLAEMVYAAGAGDRLVGVVEFSDFPAPVRQLPRVGDAFRVDYEAVAALKPDLILAWTSGNPPETVARLRSLGFRVVALEPTVLADIGRQLAAIGALAGSGPAATTAAAAFQSRLDALAARTRGLAPIRVFLQLSDRPYFTVTDRHFLGQGLRLCGGTNVFGGLPGLTAIVAVESILDAAPQAIIASDMGGGGRSPLAGWQDWPALPAMRTGSLYLLDADLVSRPSVRILDGVEAMCDRLDEARARLR